MKEVLAIIRMNMVNATKKALESAGYPAFSCRKCLGRGKKSVDDTAVIDSILATGDVPGAALGENLSEYRRLIAKRFFMLMVEDGQVDDVVKIIIDTNQTGNPGDGKIFVLPVVEAYTVRTGQTTKDAY
ncbi:P-II family nitrogen regulator [Oscillospiraceae bacterium WX1]